MKNKYAKFLLEGCLKLKAGDKLFIIGNSYILDFILIIKEEAQKLGILEIETLISDVKKQKELFLTGNITEILKSPLISKEKYNEMAEAGYAFLNLSSPLPNYFQDIPSEIITQVTNFQVKSIKKYREYQDKGLIKWNISAVANKIWAEDIGKTEEELWDLIFTICLIKEDPIEAWNKKIATLKRRADYLNSLKIDKLIYQNSLGTNLEIGLPKDYLFQSAEGTNLVNMPTEEVFTSPDRLRVNGRVYSSKVLLFNNAAIEDFYLEFKEGKIVNYGAKKGQDILKGIIETDAGSKYLGEVALVDFDSPISKTNLIFKNTLYDENASCHLAIGASFRECIKDGFKKSDEELIKLGLNQSSEHVDFFIGTRDLTIKAGLQNGQYLVIMENGNFVEV